MNRLAFRIFDPNTKRFHYSGSTPSMLAKFFEQTATLVTVHEMTYEQSTNLRDKNGREAYKGDIGRDINGRIFTIVFVEHRIDCHGFMLRYEDDSYNYITNSILINAEVIGTIHTRRPHNAQNRERLHPADTPAPVEQAQGHC